MCFRLYWFRTTSVRDSPTKSRSPQHEARKAKSQVLLCEADEASTIKVLIWVSHASVRLSQILHLTRDQRGCRHNTCCSSLFALTSARWRGSCSLEGRTSAGGG